MVSVALIQPKCWANIYNVLRSADGLGIDWVYVVESRVNPPKKGKLRYDIDKHPFQKLIFINDINAFEHFIYTHPCVISFELTEEHHSHSIFDYWILDKEPEPLIVFGPEDGSIPESILQMSKEIVEIPMKGKVRCMNVACIASIVMYDYIKERNNGFSH